MADITRTQYQHFVPQFILRNFSHPYKARKNDRKNKQRSSRKGEKRMYPGDAVVNTLDLSTLMPTICEARVDRVLGQMDMYRDTSKPSSEQQQIEQMFSRMEDQASVVIRKITKAFEQTEQGLWLTRQEKDLIRKFLFLLKYRGSTFHRRFYQDTKDYQEDDRELLWEHMKEKGYKRPMDVWFNNLKTIMELKMDPGKAWIAELPKRMYIDDAMWFVLHVEHMYMAICTTSNPSDEFILTDNSYNVFEGPYSFATDKTSGKVEAAAYAPLHEFAPISPKLMIILRSFLMPVPEEDANPARKGEREFFRSMAMGISYKDGVKSLLSDLPITKARNNYSDVVDGRVVLNPNEDGAPRKDHRFCFKYFPINTKHVHTINAILLQNAHICSRVVFDTRDNFSRTLEAHLTSPWNMIIGEDSELRLAFLKRLGDVSKALGSQKEPVWTYLPNPEERDIEDARLKILEFRRSCFNFISKDTEPTSKIDSEFSTIYKRLGGSQQTVSKDVEQACLMWTLRVKIDSWSQGIDEYIRHKNRLYLTEIYLCLPPRRVWLYVKQIRAAHLGKSQLTESVVRSGDYSQGPEDVIVQVSQVMKLGYLTKLMYKATMNDIWIKQQADINLWAKISNIDGNARAQFKLLKKLNLSDPRSIRECGIESIEKLAKQLQYTELQTPPIPILTIDEQRELLSRIKVRSKFDQILDGMLEPAVLKAFKKTFFEVLYPAPPSSC